MSANANALAKSGKFGDLRRRLVFLVLALIVYRIGAHIPVPGIDPVQLKQLFNSQSGGILNLFNMFSGGALSRFTVFALGIMPYISASIIMQLMTYVVPTLEALKKEGEAGRRKITQYTRYGTLGLAIFKALGIALALAMPERGWRASAVLVIVALSLLIPWNVVGTIWQIFGRSDIGLLGHTLQQLGFDYSYTGHPTHAWFTVLVMDVWHWTPLVALLAYAGLRAIPDAYYQAARIDGASPFAVFWHIQLPKLRGVLMIAVLLRFMDSFMIYTEPFVLTGGGPGSATTFLSQYLTQKAVGQFDLGPAAAFSLIYFLIILLLCFVLYNGMQRLGHAGQEASHG